MDRGVDEAIASEGGESRDEAGDRGLAGDL
jgi:hypothetical protein